MIAGAEWGDHACGFCGHPLLPAAEWCSDDCRFAFQDSLQAAA